MAIVLTGFSNELMTSGNTGSVNVNVPSGTTYVVALYGYFDTGMSGAPVLTLGGDTLVNREHIDSQSYAQTLGLSDFDNPSVGASVSFTWDYPGSGAPAEGGWVVLNYFSGVDLPNPIRATDVDAAETTNSVSATVTSQSTDTVLAGAAAYQQGPALTDCTLHVDDGGAQGQVQDEQYDVGLHNSVGASSTVVDMTNEYFSAIIACSIREGAGEPPGGLDIPIASYHYSNQQAGG